MPSRHTARSACHLSFPKRNLYGKNIRHCTQQEATKIFHSRGEAVFSMWEKTRLYARVRGVPHLLPRNGDARTNSRGKKSVLVNLTMHYDLLVRIKNATQARRKIVRMPFSGMDFSVAKVLMQEGYLKDVRKKSVEKKHYLELELAQKDSPSALSDFRIVSKPGRRLYIGYRTLRPVRQGYGVGVLSTPKGILTAKEARKEKVGGEYLFEIW